MSRRGWMLFAAMSVIWGIPYLLIKVADEGVSVPVLVFARTAIAAVLLLPVALRRRQIRVLLQGPSGSPEVIVEDNGPGIDPQHLERVAGLIGG